MAVSLRAAAVVSTTLEGILYGFSLFMFGLAGWILLRDRSRRHISWGMVSAGVGLLVLSTAEMGVNIARMYQGFLTKGLRAPGGPEGFFGDVTQTTFVVKSVLYNAQTLILDAVVIYRTYIVWQTFLIVIVPIMGWFGLVAVSIGLNNALATANAHKGDVFAAETGRWITTLYAMTLATNLSSTLLLAYKIWSIARRSAQYRAHNIFAPVIRVIIESGAIYSMTITAALISFVAESPGVYVILDLISPIISIVFNMLIIRIGMASERAHLPPSQSGGGSHPVTTWPSTGASRVSGMRRRADGSYVMQDLKVEITRTIEDDSDIDPHTGISAVSSSPGTADAELALKRAHIDAWKTKKDADGVAFGSGSASADLSEDGSVRDSGSFVAVSFANTAAAGKAVDRGYAV